MCLYIIIKIRFIRNKPKQTWFFNKLFNKYLSRVKMFNNQVIDFLTFTTFETILQSINFWGILFPIFLIVLLLSIAELLEALFGEETPNREETPNKKKPVGEGKTPYKNRF